MSKQQRHFRIHAPGIDDETREWLIQLLEMKRTTGAEGAEAFMEESFKRCGLTDEEQSAMRNFLLDMGVL